MAATPQNPPLSGLARALVQAGQLKEAEAEQLLAQAQSSKISLIEQIISSQKAGARISPALSPIPSVTHCST
jgi:type IV pilus assembly protein PilB